MNRSGTSRSTADPDLRVRVRSCTSIRIRYRIGRRRWARAEREDVLSYVDG
eukprot:COSAG02_NODE_32555_length_514_cov_1.342169_1_plen_50_part_10